jgi:hypothetical protein
MARIGFSVAIACLLAAGADADPNQSQTQTTGVTVPAAGETGVASGSGGARYRVNYRPAATDPWQLYTEARTLAKANTIADEMRQSGYLAEVVDTATPLPQFYPDAAATSASRYYPTSNFAADYNTYVVPGGNYGYGWYGGWNPWYRHRVYPSYWWNGARYWHGGGWGAHAWGNGWNHPYNWGDHWNNSHRNWNYSHGERGTHATNAERHAANAHHGYAAHRATAGHQQAGHHAAAAHGNMHGAAHRGSGHFPGGARTGGRRGGGRGHAGGGHVRGGGGHHTAGRHAGGMHGRHLDP